MYSLHLYFEGFIQMYIHKYNTKHFQNLEDTKLAHSDSSVFEFFNLSSSNINFIYACYQAPCTTIP